MKFQKVEFLKEALREDIGRGDLARALIDEKSRSEAVIISKENGVLSGVEYVRYLNEIVDVEVKFFFKDGDEIKKGDVICELKGSSRDLLSCERTILDILQHSSGIATNAKKFVELSKGKIKVVDTRKTRPLLRVFEKYSAKNGGIINHRRGLDDCLMLKDTHLALFKNITEAVQKARKTIPFTTKIEVECETYEQAVEAMQNGVEIVMCDNMDEATIKKVVKYRNKFAKESLIEVSGNISLENIQKYVELGVEVISSGSIIHHATFLDFSMKLKKNGGVNG